MSNFYIDSFKTFFKIGLFTFGGGYAMIPLIEQEVVDRHKWLNKEEFIDMIAVAQSLSGSDGDKHQRVHRLPPAPP